MPKRANVFDSTATRYSLITNFYLPTTNYQLPTTSYSPKTCQQIDHFDARFARLTRYFFFDKKKYPKRRPRLSARDGFIVKTHKARRTHPYFLDSIGGYGFKQLLASTCVFDIHPSGAPRWGITSMESAGGG